MPIPETVASIPLAGALCALGFPSLVARVPRGGRTAAVAATAIAVVFAGAFLAARATFDPYEVAIVAVIAWACLATLDAGRGAPPLSPADVAVFLLLWLTLDLRWMNAIFPGDGDAAYEWWSLLVAGLGLLGFGRLRGSPGVELRWIVPPTDLVAALAGLAAMAAIVIPVGLGIGFLRYPPSHAPEYARALVLLPGILLTVALPEEILFRGVLQSGLERRTGRPALAIAAASLIFGLTHWNNADTTANRLAYTALASVAGAIYGAVFRRTGTLLAPALCHAAVDTVWELFLR
jgi:membrane protease YdiL (CAAX protease family)